MTDQEISERGDVVVGYDGSPAAAAAVTWAACEAELLGCRLRLITAFSYSAFAAGPYAVALVEDFEAEARAIGEEGQRLAAKTLDPADITLQPVVGSTASALVEATKDARLVVVGTRGRGGAASALLGSVSFAVTAHAHCTAVVVPEPAKTHPAHGPVVVGVDDSSSSMVAVHHASDYAARHDRPLLVLAAWQRPMTPGLQEASWGHPGPGWSDAAQKEAQEHAARAARSARQRHPQLSVEVSVVEGPAGPALSLASRTADLVVVGTRGLGGFERLLLGSVSRAALHATTCPVAVVRA